MSTLIINGSPRAQGNCAQIVEKMGGALGNARRVDVYRTRIAPCQDCRSCHKTPGCAIKDDMDAVLDEGVKNIVILSPVYMGTLTPPMLALATRFQADYTAKRFLKAPIQRGLKRAVLILVGGGDGKPDEALRMGKMIARGLNASLEEPDIHMYLNTDHAPAVSDESFVRGIQNSLGRFQTL